MIIIKILLFVSKGYDSKTGVRIETLLDHYTPIGTTQIAAVLKKNGHKVKILDAGISYKKNNLSLVEEILDFRPDYVGFSALTYNFDDSYDICVMLKTKNPDIKVIFGGVHITLHKTKILNLYPKIDYIIVGEGELAFNAIVSGKDPSKIPGVFYVQDNKIFGSYQTEEDLVPLDDLPFPAYELIEGFPKSNRPSPFTYTKKPTVNIVTSRGCPFNCSFCYNQSVNKKVRFNSAKYVVDLIEWLQKNHSIKYFEIYDDLFMLDDDRIIEFCKEIKQRKLKISFSCCYKANSNRDLLLMLKEAGLYCVNVGIESFSTQILSRHKKGTTLESMCSDLMFLYENEIWPIGLFIVGLPGETINTLKETENMIKKMPLKMGSVMRFRPYYGTPIYEELENEGSLIEDVNDWRNFNRQKFIFLPKDIPSVKILEKYHGKISVAHMKSNYYKKITSKTRLNDIHGHITMFRYSGYLIKDIIKHILKMT